MKMAVAIPMNYEFERIGDGRSYRDPDDAERARDVFLSRVGAQAAPVRRDREVWALLLEHATEFPLNIEWYERAIRDREETQSALVAVTALVVVGGLAAAVYVPVHYNQASTVWAASAGLILSAILAGARILAQLADTRSQLTGFWEASSNLKEALFTFERTWRGKVVVANGAVDRTFADAVRDQLRLARAETRKERAEFFKNMRSPADVITSVEQAIAQLREKLIPAVAAAQQQVASDANKDDLGFVPLITAARKRVVTAIAQEAVADAKVRRAVELRDDAAAQAARKELAQAQLDAVSARAELDALLRLGGGGV